MTVNATLISAQLAAQEATRAARAQFQASHFAPAAQGAGFTAALEKEGFAPLPLKQVATPAPAAAAPDSAPAGRPGSRLNIIV